MQAKKIVIAISLTGLLAIAGLSGCSKSGNGRQDSGGEQNRAENAQANQPSNHVIDDLKSRLKVKPNDADTLQRLGDAYFDMKQFNESVSYYKKALEFKKDDADLYNDIGLSLHYLGNSAEGLRYVEEGAIKNPYHQRIWLTKGFILAYGMGDLNAAKAAWEKANALNPQSQIGKAAADFLAQFNKK